MTDWCGAGEGMFLRMEQSRWAPSWARTLAAVVCAFAAGLITLFVVVIVDDLSYRGDKFDGLAAALAGFGIGVLVFVAAPWVWFLVRGGKATFGAGAGLLAGVLVFAALWGLT